MVQEQEEVVEIGWDDFEKEEAKRKEREKEQKKEGGFDNDGPGLFLKLDPKVSENYALRFVRRPIKFRKHFEAFRSLESFKDRYPISPAREVEDKALDVAWQKGAFCPSKRFAGVVINRANGACQLVESGTQVFGPVGTWAKLAKKQPHGEDEGIDFLIEVSKNAGGNQEYTCTADPAGPSPLTDEEKEAVAQFEANMLKFSQEKHGSELGWKFFFRAETSERMNALWDMLPEEKQQKKLKEYEAEREKKKAESGASTPATEKGKAAETAPEPEKAKEEVVASATVEKTAEAESEKPETVEKESASEPEPEKTKAAEGASGDSPIDFF